MVELKVVVVGGADAIEGALEGIGVEGKGEMRVVLAVHWAQSLRVMLAPSDIMGKMGKDLRQELEKEISRSFAATKSIAACRSR